MNQLFAELKGSSNLEELAQRLLANKELGVNPQSVHEMEGNLFFLQGKNSKKVLILVGTGTIFDSFTGELFSAGAYQLKKAPLNHENAKALRTVFPWTAPQSFGTSGISLGLGDRLGLASPGHLQAVFGTEVKPVLAQQSMRELGLTNRTYADVLDAASFAVFQVGYKGGFGADGDHLKTGQDIQVALDLGFSMITLDCSEHINNEVMTLSDEDVKQLYDSIAEFRRQELETKYLQQEHKLTSGRKISFDPQEFQRMVLVYKDALVFAKKIYDQYIGPLTRDVDFEISIDEIPIPTSPQDHYFVATELLGQGIKVSGVAPRFCGAFEKGIDYKGDLSQFEAEFIVHAEIAEHYGYKVSVHSGSDKFSIFPIVGKYSSKRLHVKTAGTNWLEALRVISQVNPKLFRELYQLGLAHLEDARKYYVVTLDLAKIPVLDQYQDRELPNLLDQNDVRQALHITYGFMLDVPSLRAGIYETLTAHEDLYASTLARHIKNHLSSLGIMG